MSFTIRQPFRLTGTLAAVSKTAFKSAAPVRAFHHAPATKAIFTSRTASSIKNSPIIKNGFKQTRAYNVQPTTVSNPTANGSLMQRLLVGGAMFGGTLFAINMVFNRETREDGGMPPFERSYLNETFMHTGLGVGIIGVAARAMYTSGFVYRIMATNPWIVMIGGLALSFGTMIATRNTDPSNYVQKYGLWTAFNVTQAAFIAPLMFMAPPAIMARAGLYTIAMMGSIAFVGATAKNDKYLFLGGPLLAGVAIVAVSGFAPLVLPATAVRTLAFTENIWLYGGLAVFGGFTLYDVQKVLNHARLAERGLIKRDPVNESIRYVPFTTFISTRSIANYLLASSSTSSTSSSAWSRS
jgi:FtsH-binding integral membrane protein